MKNIAAMVGEAIRETSPLNTVYDYKTVGELQQKWGIKVVEYLRERGIYVNAAKADPSGRWA